MRVFAPLGGGEGYACLCARAELRRFVCRHERRARSEACPAPAQKIPPPYSGGGPGAPRPPPDLPGASRRRATTLIRSRSRWGSTPSHRSAATWPSRLGRRAAAGRALRGGRCGRPRPPLRTKSRQADRRHSGLLHRPSAAAPDGPQHRSARLNWVRTAPASLLPYFNDLTFSYLLGTAQPRSPTHKGSIDNDYVSVGCVRPERAYYQLDWH